MSRTDYDQMPRPRSDADVDLTSPHDLTAGLIQRLQCPDNKSQVFLRDARGNGLRVRATPSGAKAYVFEAKLGRQTIRRTLGDVRTLTIEEARVEARQQQMLLDKGHDPRDMEKEQIAAREAESAQRIAEQEKTTVTGHAAWQIYVEEGRELGFTERGPWSARHHQDHLDLVDPGGKPFKRGKGTTAPGPLSAILSLPLIQIDEKAIQKWLQAENASRPARAALAFRLLRGFLNWCKEQEKFKSIANHDAHTPRSVRRHVRRQKPPEGALQREQLGAWFKAVRDEPDLVRSSYLQCLLLTGARKSEIAELKRSQVTFTFGGTLWLKDKVENVDGRKIPCTPYVMELLKKLPENGEYVFGPQAESLAHNAAYNHRKALRIAGLPEVAPEKWSS